MTAIVHVQRWVSHTLQSGGEPMIAECRCSGASGRAPTAADRCPRHFAAGFICYKQLRVFLATIVLYAVMRMQPLENIGQDQELRCPLLNNYIITIYNHAAITRALKISLATSNRSSPLDVHFTCLSELPKELLPRFPEKWRYVFSQSL